MSLKVTSQSGLKEHPWTGIIQPERLMKGIGEKEIRQEIFSDVIRGENARQSREANDIKRSCRHFSKLYKYHLASKGPIGLPVDTEVNHGNCV